MAPGTTIVLIHGAFTDASCWWPVVLRLLGSGRRVLAPPITGRSFAGDGDYIRAFVERIEGQVLLVGHDYGAAVASVAGDAENVIGLVFVAGYALDADESVGGMRELFAPTEVSRHLVAQPFPDGEGAAGTEITVAIDQFPHLLAAGLPADEASVLAVSQRPIAFSVLSERADRVAWRSRPSWGVVATQDLSVHPELQRFGYRRARCQEVVELDGPHLVVQTHAAEIAAFLDGIVSGI